MWQSAASTRAVAAGQASQPEEGAVATSGGGGQGQQGGSSVQAEPRPPHVSLCMDGRDARL